METGTHNRVVVSSKINSRIRHDKLGVIIIRESSLTSSLDTKEQMRFTRIIPTGFSSSLGSREKACCPSCNNHNQFSHNLLCSKKSIYSILEYLIHRQNYIFYFILTNKRLSFFSPLSFLHYFHHCFLIEQVGPILGCRNFLLSR